MSDEGASLERKTRRFAALSPNLQGAVWMLASALSFTAMTTLIASSAKARW